MSAEAPQTTVRARETRPPWVLLAVPVLFLALHVRALDYDFVWTDQGEIVMGLMIRPLEHWPAIFAAPMVAEFEAAGAAAPRYYRPLQVLALSAIDELAGRRPANFRALNFALGSVTAWLIAWLVYSLMGDRVAALVAGLTYAVHPANLENHVWIAGLSHSLAAFFLAVSLVAGIAVQRSGSRIGFGVSAAALVLALLSKENAVVGPVLLFFGAVAVAGRERASGWITSPARFPFPSRRVVALVLIQAVVVAIYLSWLRPAVLGGALGGDRPIGGRWSIHLPTALGHWADTLAWLVLPWSSNSSDVVRVMGSPWRVPVVLAGLLVLASAAVWLRAARGHTAFVALGLAWVWLAFAPTSGLIPINHMRGERYVSLSLFGWAVLLPALAFALARLGRAAWARPAAIAACSILVAFYAERTMARMPDWQSERRLFEADLAGDPLYREAYLQLARLEVSEGDFAAARDHLDALRAIGPAFQGHTSYLNPSQVVGLYCGINLELAKPEDNLEFFAELTPESSMVKSAPGLAHCGAMSILGSGGFSRGAEILEAIYAQGGAYGSPAVAAEIAFAYARAGRRGDARRWLAALEGVQLEGALAHKRARARAIVESAAQ